MPASSEAPPGRWSTWLHALGIQGAEVQWQLAGDALRPVLTGSPVGWDRAATPPPTDRVLHLPAQTPDGTAVAAAAHAAAHWRFGGPPQSRKGLKPVQQALFATLEDARIESLALRELPGLRCLWLPFHQQDAPEGNGFEALLARLARCLLDPRHEDPHAWVRRARDAFLAVVDDALQVRTLASRLGNDIGQMRLPFNPRTYRVHAAYRDDGSCLWEPEAAAPASDTTLSAQAQTQDAGGARELLHAPAHEEPVAYPEWDARIARYRADWCQVYACEPAVAPVLHSPPCAADRRRMARAFASLRHGLPQRAGLAAIGDEFHPIALVDARVQVRSGRTPGERVYVRRLAPPQPLAVQVLLDVSASTQELLPRMLSSALACVAALESAGHRSALTSFASRTRHRVEVRMLKDWHEGAVSAPVLARCAAQRSGGSTRMGAALRHAIATMPAAGAHRPIVLLVTDGDPHDVDAPDPQYLRGDLRRAIVEAQRQGVVVRGMLVGSGALPRGLPPL